MKSILYFLIILFEQWPLLIEAQACPLSTINVFGDVNGGGTDKTLPSGYQYVFPQLSFPCDGVITQWVIGMEDGQSRRTLHLQVWYQNETNSDLYHLRDEVIFYKPSNAKLATIDSCVTVSAGDIVGVYMYMNRLEVAYTSVTGYTALIGMESNGEVAPSPTLSVSSIGQDSSPRISVVFEQSNSCTMLRYINNICLTGFNKFGITDADYLSEDQLILPQLRFECRGIVTHWILGSDKTGSITFQIWQPISDSHFVLRDWFKYSKANNDRIITISASMSASSGDVVGISVDAELEVHHVPLDGYTIHRLSAGNTVSLQGQPLIGSSVLLSAMFEQLSESDDSTSRVTAPNGDSKSRVIIPSSDSTSKVMNQFDVNKSSVVIPIKSSVVIPGNLSNIPTTPGNTIIIVAAVSSSIFLLVCIAIATISVVLALREMKVRKTEVNVSADQISDHDIVEETVPHYAVPSRHAGLSVAASKEMSLSVSAEYQALQFNTSRTFYQYVPTAMMRFVGQGKIEDPTVYEEMKSIYSNASESAYDDILFYEPPEKLDELYTQLHTARVIEMPRLDLRLTKVLGHGEFGEVHRGVWASNYGSQEVAIKMLKPGSGERDQTRFLQEAAIMAQFRHPNIVRMFGAVTLSEPVLLVLEFLSRGDLLNHLNSLKAKRNNTILGPSVRRRLLRFCREIAEGMKYLSLKGFIHRDLAARNILLDKDMKCKIADFGMSKNLDEEEYYVTTGGRIPIKWTSPEALFFKKYNPASDVWSYGMLMFEIWSLGEKPFPSKNVNEVIVILQDPAYIQPPPCGCPREVFKTMVLCWNGVHHNRPDFTTILQMLQKEDNEMLEIPSADLKQVDHPQEATRLGASGHFAHKLYIDLQKYYQQKYLL